MSMVIGVDCWFKPDGSVRVRRVAVEEDWIAVGQGRQWVDGNGRHVLIMLPHNQIRQITLRAATMTWEMVTVSGSEGPRLV